MTTERTMTGAEAEPAAAGTHRTRMWWLVAATPLMVLLTHYAAVIPHEFAHSIMAWLTGIKAQPFDITWGGTSPLNLLLLADIDENVDYDAARAAGQDWQSALTAFAGPGIVNGGFFLLSTFLIRRPWLRGRPVLANALFWFLLMNLGNLYDYVPMRVFADHGDVYNFSAGSGVSPWFIFVIGTYVMLWAIVSFYRTSLPLGLRLSGFVVPGARAVPFVVATAVLFGYFANPSLLWGTDTRLQTLAALSIMAILPVVVLLWRRIVLAPFDISIEGLIDPPDRENG
ncbi:hypothetical protein ACEXQE_14385 [Herbiconiux sp. P17]|uniref:hypothetical protein n=1 Tax=Herbiconiux wuyangfengii TaxID=3342794 RepID=UPI0035B87D0B